MNQIEKTNIALHFKNPLEFINWNAIKSALKELRVMDNQTNFDAREHFESYYHSLASLDDRYCIGPGASEKQARFHYNRIENAILKGMAGQYKTEEATHLDLGAGTGHWIDFYRTYFGIKHSTCIEISKTCGKYLKRKFPDTRILIGDIANPKATLPNSFDIISAVSVLCYIINDDDWLQAIQNMSANLNKDGVIIIGEQLGLLTHNIQVQEGENSLMAFKRVRSMRAWRQTLQKCDLKIEKFIRTQHAPELFVPRSHVMILKRSSAK